MNTIQVDKEELRGIIREAVQKKLASLKESKGAAEPKAAPARKKSALTEAQRLEKAREALKVLQEAIGHTPHGSRLGPAGAGMKDEAMGGGVPGAMAPMGGAPKMEGSMMKPETSPDHPKGLLSWMQDLPPNELKTLQRVQYSRGDAEAVKVMRRIDPKSFEGYSDEEILHAAEQIDFDTMEVVMGEAAPPAPPGGSMGAPMEAGKPTVASPKAADELRLFMENEFDIWEGNQKKSIEKNLALKMKKGKYDASLAPKIWMYLVDAAAQKYIKKFGSAGDRVDSMFNKATRMQVASELAQEFEQAVKSGEKDLDELIAAI